MNNIEIAEDLIELSSQMKGALKNISTALQQHKEHPIHQRNHFNRKFSLLNGFFVDLKTVIHRLHTLSQEKAEAEREARRHWTHTKGSELCPEHQELMQKSSRLLRQNMVDLKSLYIFAKIFFDQYVEFMDYVLQVERRGLCVKAGKRGEKNYSVSTLRYNLRDYAGGDSLIERMKTELYPKLNALYVYIVEYRDTHIMHPGLDTWSDTWTLSNPDGSTRFLTSRPSSTPLEIAFVIRNFLEASSAFLCENMDLILEEWVIPVVDDFPLRSWEIEDGTNTQK